MVESTSKWYHNYLQQLHERKLLKIKQGSEKTIDNSIPSSLNFIKTMNLRSNYDKQEHFKSIYKTNRILLNKISEISKRKVINYLELL